MTPESAFLLALCRGDGDSVRAVTWSAVDVDVTRRLAAEHQVDALCSWQWRRLLEEAPESAPPESHAPLAAEWRHAYLHNLLRNEHLCDQLGALQHALSERGVTALVLKGPWVAYRAYPDSGARPITDIDLCIRLGDYTRTRDALRAVGYDVPAGSGLGPDRALRRAHYGRQLRFEGVGKHMLELHFRVVNVGPPRDETWIWDRTDRLDLPGCAVTVPGPEAMLLHLLLHVNQHGFSVLRLLYDVRFALDALRGKLDWDQLLRQTFALGCAASVHQTLLLATELAGAVVPPEVVAEVRPSWPRRRLFSMLWDVPAARRLAVRRRPMELEAPRLFLLEMGGPADKLRYLVNILREAGGLAGLVRTARKLRS